MDNEVAALCDCLYCNDGREHMTCSNRLIHWCESHGEWISDIGICAGCQQYDIRVDGEK